MLNMKSTFFFNDRLVQAMNNMLKVPLTIVSAQIGAGKTTAVRAALMNQPNQTILWHTFYKKMKKVSGRISAKRSAQWMRLPENFYGR